MDVVVEAFFGCMKLFFWRAWGSAGDWDVAKMGDFEESWDSSAGLSSLVGESFCRTRDGSCMKKLFILLLLI